jgi:predicted nucleotidyltransferase/predicted transcriptional regulator
MVSIDNAKNILKAFFHKPTKSMYIREVEKECELSYERVQHYLNELEKAGALKSAKRGKIKEYTINRRHGLVLKIFSLLEMERRQKFYKKNSKLQVWLQNVVDALLSDESIKKSVGKTISDVKFILLFGSAARGESRVESDIDLLIAVNNKDSKFEEYVNTAVKKRMDALTGKKFSMHIVDMDELRTRWAKESVYSTIWLDHIVLYGDENFWMEVLEMGEPI